jgi:hypothetical protein
MENQIKDILTANISNLSRQVEKYKIAAEADGTIGTWKKEIAKFRDIYGLTDLQAIKIIRDGALLAVIKEIREKETKE